MTSPLDDLLAQFEPKIAAAFRECIEQIKNAVVLKTIVERLERHDIQGAIRAIQFEPQAFTALEMALQDAFNAGGVNFVQELPILVAPDGTRVLFQFGVRNFEAESTLRNISSILVTLITDDQREALRIALQAGLSRGQNPTSTALEIVGRINRVTGRREGGTIGLAARQVEFIAGARESLLAGDIKGMRRYLEMKTRDKRFDRTVLAAIRDGKPLPASMVQKIIGRLSDINLKLRGDMIGLEETRTAIFAARNTAMQQQIRSGKVAAQDVKKRWRHTANEHPRIQHIEMDKKEVDFDQPFILPDGTQMQYPHDPNAPARHKIGCKCRYELDIDYLAAGLRRYRARAA